MDIPEATGNTRWESTEQYEKRTGEPWPDDWPVYCRNPINCAWDPMRFADTKQRIGGRVRMLNKVVICATEAGPPPRDWVPEGDSNADGGKNETDGV
jgi:hypothetical protein